VREGIVSAAEIASIGLGLLTIVLLVLLLYLLSKVYVITKRKTDEPAGTDK
jgi:hypothetical protein